MKKKLLLLGWLFICNILSYGQNLTVKPLRFETASSNEQQSFVQNKKLISNSKAIIWSSSMLNSSQWVTQKLANQSVNILNGWQWIADTSLFSADWKYFVSPQMNSATPTQGVFYFNGISNLVNLNYGTSNATITNALPISTIGHPAVNIRFYQLYKSYNSDSALFEFSTDNINWNSILVNPEITSSANNYVNGWKEISLTQWAGNQSQLWIRFRFFSPDYIAGWPQIISGGIGWAIDDVELFDPANNNIVVTKSTLYDGYTEIPSGLAMPMYYDADIINLGGLTQTNVKLHGVELISGNNSTSIDTTIDPGERVKDLTLNSNFLSSFPTLGTYKVMSYISSDSIPFALAQDTFDINIVCDTCMYSRDNDTYTGSRWAGSTANLSDPYNAASRFQVNQDRIIYGANCVVDKDTKVGSKIKAVLFKYFSNIGARYIVASSSYYNITAADIPSTVPMVNPTSISLPFTSGYTMQKDSLYWVGIQVNGGTDTVKIATDNTGVPQPEQSSLFLDLNSYNWYIWAKGNVPALMIRALFNFNFNQLSNLVVISGPTSVYQGQNTVTYSIPVIVNATSYIWTLPNGCSGTSNTNSITVNYGSSAVSGNITVKGSNATGNGFPSSLYVTVNPVVPFCSAQFEMVADTTAPHVYYVVNNASGVLPLHFYWSWGDGSHDTTALPSHTYSTGGYYNICLSISDSTGCTVTYCDSSFLQKSGNSMISVTVIPGTVVGIADYSISEQIKIYPNPAKDNLTIDLHGVKNMENTTVSIYDLFGKLLLQKTILQPQTKLNISQFAKGIYIIKVNNDKHTMVSKFVKE